MATIWILPGCKDDFETAAEDLPEPEALAQEALGELEAAMADLHSILIELGDRGWSE